MICPLCGYKFIEKNACHGCGLSNNCSLIRCPSCSYEFAESSRIVSFFKSLIGKIFGKRHRISKNR